MKKVSTSTSKINLGFNGIVTSVDESILGAEYSPMAYNFTFRKGALKSDLGIDFASGYYPQAEILRRNLPSFAPGEKIVDAFIYHRRENGEYDDRFLVQMSDGIFYHTKIFEDDVWHILIKPNTKERVCGVSYNYDGNDVFLLSGEEIGLYIFDGETAVKVEDGPGFSSIAIHFERVFGTVNGKENQVWFSSSLDPTNWVVSGDEAGYVNFHDECGEIIKVVSFLGYLYIFREHGIYRLTAYGDQEEFSLKKMFTDTGRIYKDTIALCGNKIIFYTDEGLHAFDGYAVSRLDLEIPTIHTAYTACGTYLENKYYLACKADLEDFYNLQYSNNCILEYDLKEKTLSILAPYDAQRLVPLKVHHATDVIVVAGREHTERLQRVDNKGAIFGQSTDKFYRTPYNDFGTDKLKIIREIVVDTEDPLTVIVVADGKETRLDFEGKPTPQKAFVDRSGHKIGFRILSSSMYNHVSPLRVKINTL
jgi:hypothetical protein